VTRLVNIGECKPGGGIEKIKTDGDHLPKSNFKQIAASADWCSAWNRQKTRLFSGHYLRNRSTLAIGILGYIGIF
jgi:hypothetical protein